MKVPLCPVNEIPEEGAMAVDFFGRSVLVYKVDGRPRAIANVCLHLGGPLELRVWGVRRKELQRCRAQSMASLHLYTPRPYKEHA